MKQFTLHDILIKFDCDFYHDEIKDAFIGHPTLSVKELITILDSMSNEDGRQEIIMMTVEALCTNRESYCICARIFERWDHILTDMAAPGDAVEYMYHADNILTNCIDPSVYTVSEDVSMAVACYHALEDTNDDFWDKVNEEVDKHIEIVKEVLQ